MLQKCYEGIARAGARMHAWVRAAGRPGLIRACRSWELEAGPELEAGKLWLWVIGEKVAYKQEFATVDEMRAARKALNGKFFTCEEHHGELGQDGHWWTVYYGEEF